MYDNTSCYQPHEFGAGHHFKMWDSFCEDIKHGSRFFSLDAKATLDEMFKNMNDYSSVTGKKPVREISGCKIFRARKANTFNQIKKISSQPSIELASPPKHLAANGRMNPVGVSFFYGAFDKDTCLSELRPAVGETLVCGEFSEVSPLRVFDFTVLNNIYTELSLFDPEYAEKYSQLNFLRSFESIISKAFIPNDTELEYLPLQAMTEYILRYVEGGIDGIIFPSAQKEGNSENIVIFDHIRRLKNCGEVIINENNSKSHLKFVEGSISIHIIKSVEYKQTETTLQRVLLESKYGRDEDYM